MRRAMLGPPAFSPPPHREVEIWPWVLPSGCSELQLCPKARTLMEAGSLPLLFLEEGRAGAHVFLDPLSSSCPALRRVLNAESRQSTQNIPWPTKFCECFYHGRSMDPDLPQFRSWVGSSSPPQPSLRGTAPGMATVTMDVEQATQRQNISHSIKNSLHTGKKDQQQELHKAHNDIYI